LKLQICLVHADIRIPRLFIGIAYLSAFLRQNGFRVNVIDFPAKYENICSDLELLIILEKLKLDKNLRTRNINLYERYRLLELLNSWCEDIIRTRSEIVGFTVDVCNYKLSALLANKIKKERKDILTIFGGPYCSREVTGGVLPKPDVVDIVVHGEGEETMLDIAKKYQESSTLDSIPGATILKDGKPKYCGEHLPIKDLDSLPFPDFTDFELQKYSDGLPINTCRGCYRSCSFCYHIVFWKEYRERSPRSVVNELKHDIQKYRIRKFFFGDSEINSNPDPSRLEKIFDLIIESRLNITWGADAIFGNLRPSLLLKMYRAGCRTLDFRVGSFNSRVLSDMNRKFTPEQIRDTLELVKKNKIIPTTRLTVGFPTETRLDFMEDLLSYYKFFDREIYVYVEIIPMSVYTGTDIFVNSQKYGVKIHEDYYEDRLRFKLLFPSWSSKNVTPSELMFRTTLFRYLHKELRERMDKKVIRPGILAVMTNMDELFKSTDKLGRTEVMTKIYSELLLLWSSSFVKKKDFTQVMAHEFFDKQDVYNLLNRID